MASENIKIFDYSLDDIYNNKDSTGNKINIFCKDEIILSIGYDVEEDNSFIKLNINGEELKERRFFKSYEIKKISNSAISYPYSYNFPSLDKYKTENLIKYVLNEDIKREFFETCIFFLKKSNFALKMGFLLGR